MHGLVSLYHPCRTTLQILHSLQVLMQEMKRAVFVLPAKTIYISWDHCFIQRLGLHDWGRCCEGLSMMIFDEVHLHWKQHITLSKLSTLTYYVIFCFGTEVLAYNVGFHKLPYSLLFWALNYISVCGVLFFYKKIVKLNIFIKI